MRRGISKTFMLFLAFLMVLMSVSFAEGNSPKEEFLTVGNIVTFGHYEQDDDESNGPEPIEWMVLDVKNGEVFLLSKYGLDAKSYNTELVDVTWETCTLRSWLNEDFLNDAFSAEEQAAILVTKVDNSKSQGYTKMKGKGGNNTQDRIFLLSFAEANRYLNVNYYNSDFTPAKNLNARVAPTAVALRHRAGIDSKYKTADGEPAGRWWLRSPGDIQYMVLNVTHDGSMSYNYADAVASDIDCVRPALWLNLESDIF